MSVRLCWKEANSCFLYSFALIKKCRFLIVPSACGFVYGTEQLKHRYSGRSGLCCVLTTIPRSYLPTTLGHLSSQSTLHNFCNKSVTVVPLFSLLLQQTEQDNASRYLAATNHALFFMPNKRYNTITDMFSHLHSFISNRKADKNVRSFV
jgi:hypothetical protein